MSVIVLGTGTAGCAVARHFDRLRMRARVAEARALKVADADSRPAILQRMAALEAETAVLAFDIDATGSYALPAPADDDGDWPAGVFHHIPLPDRDDRERIRAGGVPGVRFLNPAAAEGLDGDGNASGGTRPNGDLAFQHNYERIERALSGAILSMLSKRQVVANPRQGAIRVFLVAGLFGGCGSGTWQSFERVLASVERRVGVRLETQPLLLLPGVYSGKDRLNSNASTYAVLKELVASSSGRLLIYGFGEGDGKARAVFHPPILLSDVNNAHGNPKILSNANFYGFVGSLIALLAYTPVGAYLESQNGDFTLAGAKTTGTGEPCHGRSIGFSSICLDRHRQYDYSAALLAEHFIDTATAAPSEESVRAAILRFLTENGLVFGDGRTDLPDRIMARTASQHRITPKRFLGLFRRACENLSGMQLLQTARRRHDIAWQQTGDFDQAVHREGEVIADQFRAALARGAREIFCDSRRGPGHAAEWLAMCGAVLEGEVAACEAARTARRAEAHEADTSAARIEGELLPSFLRMNSLRKLYNADAIDFAATELKVNLEKATLAEMDAAVLDAAGSCLRTALDAVRAAFIENDQVRPALVAAREALLLRRDRAIGQTSDFACSNGLVFPAAEEDLVDIDRRTLDAAARATILDQLFIALGEQVNPVATLSGMAGVLRFLDDTLADSLLTRLIEGLDVWDELCHRFPDPSVLGAVLREREYESFERLGLTAGDRDSVVRVIGIASHRYDSIRPLLEKHTTQRGSQFVPVDTGRRDRIDIVQFRGVFPIACNWRGMASCRADYLTARAENPFEKHHPCPGDRYLPEPGLKPSNDAIRQIVLKAWILDRLRRAGDGSWLLAGALPGDPQIPLGERFEVLESADGYRLGVDVTSDFTCHYLAHGPDAIRERMSDLQYARPSKEGVAQALAQLGVTAACRLIEEELAWWSRNSAAALMAWSAPGGRAGLGVVGVAA